MIPFIIIFFAFTTTINFIVELWLLFLFQHPLVIHALNFIKPLSSYVRNE